MPTIVQLSVHRCTIAVRSITYAQILNGPNHFEFACGDIQQLKHLIQGSLPNIRVRQTSTRKYYLLIEFSTHEESCIERIQIIICQCILREICRESSPTSSMMLWYVNASYKTICIDDTIKIQTVLYKRLICY